MTKLVIAILCTVISIGGLGLLIFVIKSISSVDGGFGNLNGASKFLAIILSIVSLVVMATGGYFAFVNYTYKAPIDTESTKELQKQINKSNDKGEKGYVQLISTSDYNQASIEDLMKTYSKSGQTAIENYAQNSDKNKSFILRNVGRDLKSKEGLFTTQLKTVSGEIVKLNDGQKRMLVFADDSEYSVAILELLHKYNSERDDKIPYTIIFPTLDGTKVDAFFQAYSSRIGTMDENSVVTIDSQPNQANQSIYTIATQEYHVTDLPSYLAIDGDSVISLAGVGSIVDTSEKLSSWLDNAFSKNKLYSEIERGVDSSEKDKDIDSSTSETNSGQGNNSGTDTGGEN